MLRFLSNIPDYDEELRRLKLLEDKGLGDYLKDFLNKLFGVNVNDGLLDLLQIIAWGVMVYLILWVLYKNFLMNDFGRGGIKVNDSVSIDGFQGIAEDADIRGHNFDSELEKALSSGDYALAVRLRYLMTLKELDRLSAIKWMEWKTPMIYVSEIEGGTDELKHLTLGFLYIKYGHYPATKEVYEEATSTSESLISMKKGGQQ